jgi:hypothetical protein
LGREDGSARAKELEKLINELAIEIEDRTAKGLKTGSQDAAVKAFTTELNQIVKAELAKLDAAEAKAKQAEKNQQLTNSQPGMGGAQQ